MKLVYGAPNYYFLCTYDEKDICKSAGFRWAPEGKEPLADRGIWWTEDIFSAAQLIRYASPKAKAQLEGASKAREASLDASRATASDIYIPVPDGLEYLPFQKAGIEYALGRENTLFGDEMGLGKTMQAIGVINSQGAIVHTLVVCPAHLKINWKREMTKWLTRSPQSIEIAYANKDFPRADTVIINYEALVLLCKCYTHRHPRAAHKDTWVTRDCPLHSERWDILIVDECHYVKNPKTKRSKAVKAVSAKRRLYLTGTPIVNRPIELWPIISELAPETFNHFWGYARRYCNANNDNGHWDLTGSSNLGELQEKLRGTIMVRRLKSEVLTELPPKVRQVIEIPTNGSTQVVEAEKAAMAKQEGRLTGLKQAVEEAKASDDPEDYKAAVKALRQGWQVAFTEMAKVRHDTAVAKIPYIIEHIKDVLNSGNKVVVFAHHHDVIDALFDTFISEAVKLDGRDSATRKDEAITAFQNDEWKRLFIGGIQAAGTGITLTAASHVIFAELDWVPGNVTQCEDRLHRLGQHDSVLVQHLVLEGSIDANIAQTMVEKQAVIDKALDEEVVIEKSAPVIPVPESATDSTSRTRIAKEAESITPAQAEAIHTALRQLAATDEDRAQMINLVGFSKIDSNIGHSLAQATRLTPKQAALGKRIALKYHRQLGEDLTAAIKGV